MPKTVKFNGQTYSVPDDATMDEIDALISGKPAAPVAAPIAATGPSPDRTGTQVMQDQAANVLEGVGLKAPTEYLMEKFGVLQPKDQPVSDDRTAGQVMMDKVKGVASTAGHIIAAPVTIPYNIAKTGTEALMAGDFANPESPAWEKGANASGQLLAGAPVIAGDVAAIKKAPDLFRQFKSKLPPPADAVALNKWMDVPAKEVKYGSNPGQQILSEKLVGKTKEATKKNVESALGKAGADMEASLKAADGQGITIDAQTPTYDAVAKATKRIGSPRDSTFQSQMQGIVDDIEAKYPNLHSLPPSQAHALKVELGDAIKWSGTTYDTPANQAMIAIYRDLNTAIKKGVTGIEPLQSRWGNLFVANKNLAESMADDVVGKGTGAQAPNFYRVTAKKAAKIGATGLAGAEVISLLNSMRR